MKDKKKRTAESCFFHLTEVKSAPIAITAHLTMLEMS
jgi:hypothetical protein